MKPLRSICVYLLLSFAAIGCAQEKGSSCSVDTIACQSLIKQCDIRSNLRLPQASKFSLKALRAECPDESAYSAKKRGLSDRIQLLEDSLQIAATENLRLIGPEKEQDFKQSINFPNSWPHHEGELVIVFRDGKYGFANRDGSMETQYEFDRADPFREDFARVAKGDKEFLIDAQGNRYETAFSVAEITPQTEAIDLTISELKVVPEEIYKATHLKVLRLGMNRLESLPAKIATLTELQYLHLTANYLMTIPEELTTMKSLRSLRLSSNSLNELPKSIGEMVGLRELYLDDNQLHQMPDGLFRLVELEKLFLGWNDLGAIDYGNIRQLKNLKVLDHSGDKIASVTEALGG